MYYRDRVGSIYSHAGFVSRINVQVGTVLVTSLFCSLFYDCYRQPITTFGPSSWTLKRKVTEIERNRKFGGVPSIDVSTKCVWFETGNLLLDAVRGRKRYGIKRDRGSRMQASGL